jgi:hypothetical protein
MQQFLNHRLTAIWFPALLGLGGGALSVRGFEQYGWALFLGLPVLVSFLASFAWSFKRLVGYGSSYGIACLSLLALGGMIMIFAIDGLFCLLMALPIALVLALPGTALGRWLGTSAAGPVKSVVPTLGFTTANLANRVFSNNGRLLINDQWGNGSSKGAIHPLQFTLFNF